MPATAVEIPETRYSLLVKLHDSEDQQAWTEFCEIYEPLIYRLARSRGLQDADAREVVQEVCVSVSRSINRFTRQSSSGQHFSGQGGFRAWLAVVTRNQTLNHLKRHRTTNDFASNAAFKLSCIVDPADPPDKALEKQFDHEHQRQLFLWAAEKLEARFSPQNWTAFWRTCVEGESIQRVAEDLQLPLSTIHVARCRVIARLRDLIADHSVQEQS